MAKKKIGHIVNTFGLKGMVKISLSTSDPEARYAVGKKVIILNEMNEEQTYTINSVIFKNNRIVYVGLDEYNDINQVEWMKERDVYADVRTKKGSFFYDDLIAMKVVTEEGEEIGTVSKVIPMPAGDYLEINGALVPFLQEVFIKSVDKKNKTITLTSDGIEAYKSSK